MTTDIQAKLQLTYEQLLLIKEYASLLSDMRQGETLAAPASAGTTVVLHGAEGPWRHERLELEKVAVGGGL
jgi:hypothetical protein